MSYKLSAPKARWLFIDALIPIGLVLFMWVPIGIWTLDDKGFVFERIIGGGDLLAVSFAFLMAFQAEQQMHARSNRTNTKGSVFNGMTVLFAMFAAITYGVIKVFHSRYDFPTYPSIDIDGNIQSMACFSISFCIFTVAYIYMAKSSLEK